MPVVIQWNNAQPAADESKPKKTVMGYGATTAGQATDWDIWLGLVHWGKVNATLIKKYSTGSIKTVTVVGQTSISDFYHIYINTGGVPGVLVDLELKVAGAKQEVAPAGFELESMAVHLCTNHGQWTADADSWGQGDAPCHLSVWA
ncbi:hypothetical protein MHYP_G00091910 [Metynnis hypsauchen]